VISELNKCNEKRYEDLVGGKLNNNNLAEIFDLNDIF
jgi:hypothetical protein